MTPTQLNLFDPPAPLPERWQWLGSLYPAVHRFGPVALRGRAIVLDIEIVSPRVTLPERLGRHVELCFHVWGRRKGSFRRRLLMQSDDEAAVRRKAQEWAEHLDLLADLDSRPDAPPLYPRQPAESVERRPASCSASADESQPATVPAPAHARGLAPAGVAVNQ